MPWEHALLHYLHLQWRDQRVGWMQRMDRIEAAELTAMAFHDPERLEGERKRAMAAAGAKDTQTIDDLKEYGMRVIKEIAETGVLED